VFTLLDTVPQDGATWIKIRDGLGNELYIDSKTQLNTGDAIPPSRESVATSRALEIREGRAQRREAAIRRIKQGLILVGVGGALYFISGLITHQAPFTILFLAPVLYGVSRLVRGGIYYLMSLG
jgi:hypothetical protein